MIGFFLGIAASVIAAAIAAALFPAVTAVGTRLLVHLFGWLPITGKVDLSGKWSSTWRVVSDRFPSDVTDNEASIRQLGNRIFVRFKNENMEFLAIGVIDSGRYVTGTWTDKIKGGYHGAFQMVIDPKTREMAGLWIGYSASGFVKSGKWEWTRKVQRDLPLLPITK